MSGCSFEESRNVRVVVGYKFDVWPRAEREALRRMFASWVDEVKAQEAGDSFDFERVKEAFVRKNLPSMSVEEFNAAVKSVDRYEALYEATEVTSAMEREGESLSEDGRSILAAVAKLAELRMRFEDLIVETYNGAPSVFYLGEVVSLGEVDESLMVIAEARGRIGHFIPRFGEPRIHVVSDTVHHSYKD